MAKKIGICFSKDFKGVTPLGHIEAKLPVYMRLLDLLQQEDFEVYILTRKTYLGDGIFNGVWKYENGKFIQERSQVKIDLVYDRSGGIKFPPEGGSLKVVNARNFKILCWDKWVTFQLLGNYMPKTFWVGKFENYKNVLDKINGSWIVIKPYNGLKGLDIYIGPKNEVGRFLGNVKKKYIAQEFIDTSSGVSEITNGLHDIRVVVVNGEVVWSHIRVPMQGNFLANAAQGGTLMEIDYSCVPESLKKIVEEIAAKFYKDYDNPIYSLDFGIGKDAKPYIFEINDLIGFPKWEMKNRDCFLKALIDNFKSKL